MVVFDDAAGDSSGRDTLNDADLAAIRERFADDPDVDAVTGILGDALPALNRQARLSEPRSEFTGVDPETVDGFHGIRDAGGNLLSASALGGSRAFITERLAERIDSAVGATVTVFADNEPHDFEVIAWCATTRSRERRGSSARAGRPAGSWSTSTWPARSRGEPAELDLIVVSVAGGVRDNVDRVGPMSRIGSRSIWRTRASPFRSPSRKKKPSALGELDRLGVRHLLPDLRAVLDRRRGDADLPDIHHARRGTTLRDGDGASGGHEAPAPNGELPGRGNDLQRRVGGGGGAARAGGGVPAGIRDGPDIQRDRIRDQLPRQPAGFRHRLRPGRGADVRDGGVLRLPGRQPEHRARDPRPAGAAAVARRGPLHRWAAEGGAGSAVVPGVAGDHRTVRRGRHRTVRRHPRHVWHRGDPRGPAGGVVRLRRAPRRGGDSPAPAVRRAATLLLCGVATDLPAGALRLADRSEATASGARRALSTLHLRVLVGRVQRGGARHLGAVAHPRLGRPSSQRRRLGGAGC